ncbi:MAG: 16S rRNA (guanine(527)-N(7))-methyltransferase RsmG [Lachnospiraceae bacterium]|nr:16S rRNA (guanine(527)-N(7))-methyltransferase RsmG [Lachnospiraceae bacterium]
MYDLLNFKNMVSELGVELDDAGYEKFLRYYELLVKWNEVMNLTAITEYDEVVVKHFVDSLSIARVLKPGQGAGISAFGSKESGKNDADSKKSESEDAGLFWGGSGGISLIDIGTGAGFPGIPLKIAFPELEVTLLDSLNKRVGFLSEVIGKLGLKGITALHGRAEDFAKKGQLRESFDLCVSRAVANLSTLSEYCLPYVKIGGKFIAYKSEKTAEEVSAAENALDKLGGKVEKCDEFKLPGTDLYRTLVVISKEKETPGKYPRKAGTPSREPL